VTSPVGDGPRVLDSRLGWAGLVVLLAATGVAMASAATTFATAKTWDGLAFLALIISLAYLATGLILLIRVRWHPVGWLLVVIAFTQAVLFSSNWGARIVTPAFGIDAEWWHWIEHISTYSLFWPAFVALFAIFPDGLGQLSPSHRRYSRRLLFACIPLMILPFLSDQVRVVTDGPLVPNPTGLALLPITAIEYGVVGVLALTLMSAAGLVVRSRNASPTVRLQHRWLLVAAGLLIAWIPIAVVASNVTGNEAWWIPIIASYIGIPVSIAIAITRYRLYEIDRIISRTLSYGAVLVILGGTYFGIVLILRRLFPVEGDISVAISTLVVAFAFLPLVRRTQRVVDRRFFRSRYDAALVVAQLATELRGSLDMARLVDRAVSVIQETFEPEDAGMWIDGTATQGNSSSTGESPDRPERRRNGAVAQV
jgi:hypothetical protein